MHYLLPVSLFHRQEPHQCFLTIVVVTSVLPGRYESNSVGLLKRLRKILLQTDATVIDSRNISIFPMCMNSRLNCRHVCLSSVTSFWLIFPTRPCCRKAPPISGCRTTRETRSSPPRPAHSHHDTRLRGWDLRSLCFPPYFNNPGTRICRPSNQTLRAAYAAGTGGKTRCPERRGAPSSYALYFDL